VSDDVERRFETDIHIYIHNFNLCILPAPYTDIVVVYFQCILPFTIEEVKFYLHVCLTLCFGSTDMRRLTTGIRSEKCVVRRFRPCANVIKCTYTNLDSTV